MIRYRKICLLGLTLLAPACSDYKFMDGGSGPDDGAWVRNNGAGKATFLSRNLYVGADVDAVIYALATPDPSDDVAALQTAVQQVYQTDWPARARAIAGEIARERPHAVGLQEVSKLDLDLSALGMPVDYHADFLPTLLAELSARGLNYIVAAQVENIVARPFTGVSLVDWDAVLIDADRVTVTGTPFGKRFSYNIGVVAPGVTLARGFVRVEATIDGQSWTILSTHLESGSQPGLDQLRAAQMTELAAYLPATGPAVVMGDFNDTPGSLMYQVAAGAGLTDVWASIRSAEPGLTCCHDSDLSNERADMRSRIDYIMARGTGLGDGGELGQMRMLGIRPSERIAGPNHPIWPSDHAGLTATLRNPVAPGQN